MVCRRYSVDVVDMMEVVESIRVYGRKGEFVEVCERGMFKCNVYVDEGVVDDVMFVLF